MGASLTARGLYKQYGAAAAVAGVDLDVRAGEFVSLLGPSGCGKTTTLRMIAGLESVDQGAIAIDGRDVTSTPTQRRGLGMVFQQYALFPNLTAFENVAFALEVIGKTQAVARRVVPEVLELVGLGGKEHRYPQELSGGEQQRVAVARAFVNRPLILLADEPTGNLDPDTSIEIMRLLDRINRTGTTVAHGLFSRESYVGKRQRRMISHGAMSQYVGESLRNSPAPREDCA